jgi:hypothetical protein
VRHPAVAIDLVDASTVGLPDAEHIATDISRAILGRIQ